MSLSQPSGAGARDETREERVQPNPTRLPSRCHRVETIPVSSHGKCRVLMLVILLIVMPVCMMAAPSVWRSLSQPSGAGGEGSESQRHTHIRRATSIRDMNRLQGASRLLTSMTRLKSVKG